MDAVGGARVVGEDWSAVGWPGAGSEAQVDCEDICSKAHGWYTIKFVQQQEQGSNTSMVNS
jgi:hypothetical protein